MKVYIGRYPGHTDSVQLDLFTNEPTTDYHREVSVEIDPWDTWNMDSTLGYIILPMLKQIKAAKHSSPSVELTDVPEHLHPTNVDEYGTDNTHHERWEYIMDEMIFAFEHVRDDGMEQFYIVPPMIDFEKMGNHKETKPVREAFDGEEYFTLDSLDWYTPGQLDEEGYKKHQERIQHGFTMFGKYYQSLWD
jgi:hypothetical protein